MLRYCCSPSSEYNVKHIAVRERIAERCIERIAKLDGEGTAERIAERIIKRSGKRIARRLMAFMPYVGKAVQNRMRRHALTLPVFMPHLH